MKHILIADDVLQNRLLLKDILLPLTLPVGI